MWHKNDNIVFLNIVHPESSNVLNLFIALLSCRGGSLLNQHLLFLSFVRFSHTSVKLRLRHEKWQSIISGCPVCIVKYVQTYSGPDKFNP